jgi:hypothetical protein
VLSGPWWRGPLAYKREFIHFLEVLQWMAAPCRLQALAATIRGEGEGKSLVFAIDFEGE